VPGRSGGSRCCSWFLAVPFVGLAVLCAHTLGYGLAGGDVHERANALERSGHSYLAHLPIYGALAGLLLVIGFACRVREGATNRPGRSIPIRLVVLLPPACFMIQEHLERYLHGDPDWFLALQTPQVLAGMALQLPFALAAAWLVRTLDRAGERLGRLMSARRMAQANQTLLWSALVATVLPLAIPDDRRERGPPRLQLL
jgi:hypothetical protein